MKHTVEVHPFGTRFECDESETVLSAALRAGLGVRYGCKHGACGSCKTRVLAGDVDVTDASTFALLEHEREAGIALWCSAYPLEDSVIDFSDYDESELRTARPVREYAARITLQRRCSPDIWQLKMQVEGDDLFEFEPRQYADINIPGTAEWRSFSMASIPGQELEFLIKDLPGGQCSTWLSRGNAEGGAIRITGPMGGFRLAEGHAPIVMVAGGTGIAPVSSMLRALASAGSERAIRLFFGARTPADLAVAEELLQTANALPNFSYYPVVSDARREQSSWEGERGLVTETLARQAGNSRTSEAYLCGPPAMIDRAIEILTAIGMFRSRIRFDKFVNTNAAVSSVASA